MAWINRLSVWAKLMLSFAAVSVLSGIVGYVGVSRLTSLSSNIETMYEKEVLGILDSENMITATILQARDSRQAILSSDPAAQDMLVGELDKHRAMFEDSLKHAEETYYRPACKLELAKVKEMYGPVFVANKQAVALARQGKTKEATATLSEARIAATALLEQLGKMSGLKKQAAENAYRTSQTSANAAFWLMSSLVLGGMVVSMTLGYVISRWFTRAIVQVDEIASGVASASQQLAAASEQLSSGAQQSASSLEETASSLEEMTATVRQNADNADQANQLANNSRETAEKGGAVVASAMKAMDEINQASRKIADIITTIDEIAFQTNLLALNAAVEAARAGEQGRGFAVVAGEVRNLAQRSATAAKEIKGLIQDSVAKVENGSQLVNQSGETLGAIVSSVKRVTDIVGEIAAASREQSAGIDQINKAVAQMDTVTQSNASQTEEMSGTAVALSGQAEQLQSVVAQFNLKKVDAAAATTASTRVTKPSRSERKAARRSVSRSAAPARPAKGQSKHELDLVGAGAGSHDGFEEF